MERYKAYRIVVFVLAIVVIVESSLLVYLWVNRPKERITKIPVTVPAAAGKIAIVIDDWGYSLNNLAVLKQINYPLTLAILPNLPQTKVISQEARRLKFEVILHLPMEPLEKNNLERNTIMASMDEREIKDILNADLDSIIYAKGVSNHMGSKATKDARIMSCVFSELKKRGLYFLDSYVSLDSVCPELTHKMKLGFARRDIFLDNQSDPEYIRGQIEKLKVAAKANGYAIGIGHGRKITLQVLRDIMPELRKEGYKFVRVSELIDK
ncbi:MAG: divergent polysaccharide deacetylase family protein [Candidatus Omnitrophota bacterium]